MKATYTLRRLSRYFCTNEFKMKAFIVEYPRRNPACAFDISLLSQADFVILHLKSE